MTAIRPSRCESHQILCQFDMGRSCNIYYVKRRHWRNP